MTQRESVNLDIPIITRYECLAIWIVKSVNNLYGFVFILDSISLDSYSKYVLIFFKKKSYKF